MVNNGSGPWKVSRKGSTIRIRSKPTGWNPTAEPYLKPVTSSAPHMLVFQVACKNKFGGMTADSGAIFDQTIENVPDEVDTIKIFGTTEEWFIFSDKLRQFKDQRKPPIQPAEEGDDVVPL